MKRDKIIKKILKKIKTGRIDSANKINERFKLDFAANIRSEVIDNGNTLLIHDVPIAKEMVQPYHDGFHYKTKEAIDGIFVEFSPVSVSHPDIQFKDMTDQEKLDNMIGYLNNGYTEDNKKYADLFLFVDKVPEDVMNKINSNQSIDVSIGFNVELDETPGEFQGKHFDKKQTKIDLDHLALLPNETGRAPFSEGVGVGADANDATDISIRQISNGIIVSKWSTDTHSETFYETEDDARNALDIGMLFDQKLKNEVSRPMVDQKIYEDALKCKVDAESELRKAQDSEKKLKDEMDTLKEKFKDYDDMKDKSEKYDQKLADEKKASDKAIADLKEKILDHEKATKSDKFTEFIERQDKAEDLQFILDDFDVKLNGLPAAKGKDDRSDMHPSDKYVIDKFEKKNPNAKVRY